MSSEPGSTITEASSQPPQQPQFMETRNVNPPPPIPEQEEPTEPQSGQPATSSTQAQPGESPITGPSEAFGAAEVGRGTVFPFLEGEGSEEPGEPHYHDRLTETAERTAAALQDKKGTVGKPVRLLANAFPMKLPTPEIHQYDVDFHPRNLSWSMRRKVFQAWRNADNQASKSARNACYDGHRTMFTPGLALLPFGDYTPTTFRVPSEAVSGSPGTTYTLTLKHIRMLSMDDFLTALTSGLPEGESALQEYCTHLHAIQLLLKETPAITAMSMKRGTLSSPLGHSGRLFAGGAGPWPLPGGLMVYPFYGHSMTVGRDGESLVKMDLSFTTLYPHGSLLRVVTRFFNLRHPSELRSLDLTSPTSKAFKDLNTYLLHLGITVPQCPGERHHIVQLMPKTASSATINVSRRTLQQVSPTRGTRGVGAGARTPSPSARRPSAGPSVTTTTPTRVTPGRRPGPPARTPPTTPTGGATEMSLEQYYRTVLKQPLQFPGLPLVRIGRDGQPWLLPLEACEVVRGQRYTKRLSREQNVEMQRISGVGLSAGKRADMIMEGASAILTSPTSLEYLRTWNADVEPRLQELEGRVLPPPRIMGAQPRDAYRPLALRLQPSSFLEEEEEPLTIGYGARRGTRGGWGIPEEHGVGIPSRAGTAAADEGPVPFHKPAPRGLRCYGIAVVGGPRFGVPGTAVTRRKLDLVWRVLEDTLFVRAAGLGLEVERRTLRQVTAVQDATRGEEGWQEEMERCLVMANSLAVEAALGEKPGRGGGGRAVRPVSPYGNAQLLFCVLADEGESSKILYKHLKTIAETKLNLVTQCMALSKLSAYLDGPIPSQSIVRAPPIHHVSGTPEAAMYSRYMSMVRSLAFKVNAKLGGVNRVLEGGLFGGGAQPETEEEVPRAPPQTSLGREEPVLGGFGAGGSTMVVGAHVDMGALTGIGPAVGISSVVAALDDGTGTFHSSVRLQPPQMVHMGHLGRSIAELFEELTRPAATGSAVASQIDRVLIFRHGLTSPHSQEAARLELDDVRYELARVLGVDPDDEEDMPKITYVAVNRSGTGKLRFFEVREALGRGRGGQEKVMDPPPGTIVDSVVTQYGTHVDFFYVPANYSKASGPVRPVHYAVISDQNGFTADDLEGMVHKLTFMAAGSPDPTTWAAPIVYARKIARRARGYLTVTGAKDTMFQIGLDGQPMDQKRVQEDLVMRGVRQKMFFI
ncbi:Eukaryotic translation initiation factor 2C [Phlyctochytrium bullatum]|nr:Eukaryotic translation initiation factor 2C [Phlyctochytrium bullatum]